MVKSLTEKGIMVAENELEIAIKNTQALFIKIISKPKCTNKLLTKPPFRFIHDIVISTLKSTGFPHRYFTTQELDSHNFNDKNSKVAFLEKLIYLVSVAKGIPLDVRPSKIVAGLDPLNTNALLLAFGSLAIDETLQKDRLIEYCINGGKIGQMPLKLESFLEKDEEQIIIHQVPAESKASKDSKEITTSSSSQEHDSQDQSLEYNSDIQHTQAILNSLISKPKCTEKLLAKPPFRFIHDVVMAVDKASFMGLDKVLSQNEMDSSKVRDKEAKIEFLSKVVKVVENYLGMVIDIKASKVVAGLEADKTRLFFQALVKAARSSNHQAKLNEKDAIIDDRELKGIQYYNDEKKNVVGKKSHTAQELTNSTKPEKKNDTLPENTTPTSKKVINKQEDRNQIGGTYCGEEDVSEAKHGTNLTNWCTSSIDDVVVNNDGMMKKKLTRRVSEEQKIHNNRNTSLELQTNYSREKQSYSKQEISTGDHSSNDVSKNSKVTSSAEMSTAISEDNHIEEIAQRKRLVNARPKTARRIPPVAAKDEDIDAAINNNIYHARPFTIFCHDQHSSKENSISKRSNPCATGMMQPKMTQDNSTVTHPLIVRPHVQMQQNNRDGQDSTLSAVPLKTTEYNTFAISESIQNIAKFVAPIVRIVEHFPKHTEQMSMEYRGWSEKYQTLYHDLVAAKNRTHETLAPLETKISHIDHEIARFQQLISQTSMQIRQNDKWIRYRRCKPT